MGISASHNRVAYEKLKLCSGHRRHSQKLAYKTAEDDRELLEGKVIERLTSSKILKMQMRM